MDWKKRNIEKVRKLRKKGYIFAGSYGGRARYSSTKRVAEKRAKQLKPELKKKGYKSLKIVPLKVLEGKRKGKTNYMFAIRKKK